MSKHTPEPWRYVPGPGGGTIEDAHGAQIAVISGQAPLRGDPDVPVEEIQEANGRLMALAPKMEEAIRCAKIALYHESPGGCWATGPMTCNPIEDLVLCPGCRALHKINGILSALDGES